MASVGTDVLGFYNPQFYANEALIQLENALGLARTIHTGYEKERNAFRKGEIINIKRPSNFTVADAPITSITDLAIESVTITLDQWREVKFKLTDQELALTQEEIIQDHIRPQAVALANDIDVFIAGMYTDVPWQIDTADPMTGADITAAKKQLFINKAPMGDEMWGMVGAVEEKELLDLAAFSQHQGAGDVGVNTQISGFLGKKYGFNMYANQNTPTHTVGTVLSVAGDVVGKLVTAGVVGDTTVSVSLFANGGGTETFKAGDIFVFTDITQKYAITADITLSGGLHIAVPISPALQTAIAVDTVCTASGQTSIGENLFYHRNWAALVVAPLPFKLPSELGAKVAVATDPITGISLRSRLYYVGLDSEVHVAMDVLFGGAVLDPNLCVRMSNEA